jgi:hypothetical protein
LRAIVLGADLKRNVAEDINYCAHDIMFVCPRNADCVMVDEGIRQGLQLSTNHMHAYPNLARF